MAFTFSRSVSVPCLPPSSQWHDEPKKRQIDVPLLRALLRTNGLPSLSEAKQILKAAMKELRLDPSLLDVDAPAQVIGDIHGQFRDLDALVGQVPPTKPLIFLGDYVDRGPQSLACMLFVLALKAVYGPMVCLLRGNHECAIPITGRRSFKEACEQEYGKKMWRGFVDVFEALPLAVRLATLSGDYLCIHAGISPQLSRAREIQRINRFREPEDGVLNDILWSDPVPIEEADEMIDFSPNVVRGTSFFYGKRATLKFLKASKLKAIIRGHQVVQQGAWMCSFGEEWRKEGPLVITLYSSSLSEDKDGDRVIPATLFVDEDGNLDFVQFPE